MRTLLAGVAACLLAYTQSPAVEALELRRQALTAVNNGDWKKAEALQSAAVDACRAAGCAASDIAILLAEQAGMLVHGGFPQAAIPLWRRALEQTTEGDERQARLRGSLLTGLGTAYDAAGRTSLAVDTWRRACPLLRGFEPEYAACRFNFAVAEGGPGAWSEMEALLPALLESGSALLRAIALTQTAQAAARAGRHERALALAAQAEEVIAAGLNGGHPALAGVYTARAMAARAAGETKLARRWEGKARSLLQSRAAQSWSPATVPAKELGREPR